MDTLRTDFLNKASENCRGILVVPETGLLFLAARSRAMCFNMIAGKWLWEQYRITQFMAWKRISDMVIMSAKREIGAWDLNGKLRWGCYLGSDWGYAVAGDVVTINDSGDTHTFDLHTGPFPLKQS